MKKIILMLLTLSILTSAFGSVELMTIEEINNDPELAYEYEEILESGWLSDEEKKEHILVIERMKESTEEDRLELSEELSQITGMTEIKMKGFVRDFDDSTTEMIEGYKEQLRREALWFENINEQLEESKKKLVKSTKGLQKANNKLRERIISNCEGMSGVWNKYIAGNSAACDKILSGEF
jgi:hypothetical protein